MTGLAWLLSFGAGFLSLSQEILWVRLVGFVHLGVPQAFSLVLGLYLLGIALGATAGKRLCERLGARPLGLVHASAAVLLGAGALDLVLPALLEALAASSGWARLLGMAALILSTAAIKATLFPIAHHLGSNAEGDRLGRSLSHVYGLNIAGATLGPLLTGFVLLDHLSLEAGFQLIGVCSVALAAAAFCVRRPAWAMGLAVAVAGTAAGTVDLQQMAVTSAYAQRQDGRAIKWLHSNRHGLLHVVDGGPQGDIVYGGNVYDGRTNTDLRLNSNRIDRAYLLAALHPAPQRVLVIGLSSGAWLRVLTAVPGVQTLDVIEINPGYEDLISRYPPLLTALQDPRTQLHIDDGRRWLNRHADARFDLIVMNTTFHWRANVSNLLSRQFMALAASRLAPGGILAFNATGSDDALATAASVFAQTYRWSNFVYAAQHDFRSAKDSTAARQRLADMAINGVPLLPTQDPSAQAAVERLLAQPFVGLAQAQSKSHRPLLVIDDWTMPTEFRHGRGLVVD